MDLISSTHSLAFFTEGLEKLNSTMASPVGNGSHDQNVTGWITLDSAAGASIVSPIVMFLAGLVGNLLALVVLHKTKTEIRNMTFYTLVAALTWNDLLGICLTSPPVLAAYANGLQMPALPTLCRFHALAMVCFGLSTPFIVCAMAVERSLALKRRYFYSKYCKPASARLLVALLWAAVLLFGALPLMGVGSFTLQYPRTWCFLHFRSYVPLDMAYAGAYAVLNLLVVVVMVICNGLVMTALCRVRKTRRRTWRSMSNASTLLKADTGVEKTNPALHQQQQQQQKQEQQQQQEQQKQFVPRRRHHRDVELQMIWLLCGITTIFSVCWAPLMMYILYCLQSPSNSSPIFGLVAVRLASLNQTLNPWIYVILRKSLLSRLSRLCHRYRPTCCCSLGRSAGENCDDGDNNDLPNEDKKSSPRRATGFHNPLPIFVQRQPKAKRSGSSGGSSPKNKYVHVGNQLCPSSQFVGLYQPVRLIADGKRSRGGGGGGGESKSSNSRSHWKSKGSSSRFVSETDQAATRELSSSVVGDAAAGGVCSACREDSRWRGDGEGQGVLKGQGHPGSFLAFPDTPSSAHSCSQAVSPKCSATTPGEEAEVVEEGEEEAPLVSGTHPPHSHSLPADGAYVDFFRHLPSPGLFRPRDVIQNGVSTTPLYRSQSACGKGEASATKGLILLSEADDHGYSSSSRMSTPERSRQDTLRLPEDGTKWDDNGDDDDEQEGADCVLGKDETRNFPEPVSHSSSSRYRTGPAVPKECQSKDVKEDSVTNEGGEDIDKGSVCLLQKTRSKETGFSRNVSRAHREGSWHLAEGDTNQTLCRSEDSGRCTIAAAPREKPTRDLTGNGQTVKQNGCPRRVVSLDFTSGVFDCRDDDDDDDEDGVGDDDDDDDDNDDDDVYDDSFSPRKHRKEGEEEDGGMARRRRKSSSRTMSSSSAGTVVDSSSGQDSVTAFCRHWSSSSASAQ